MHPCAHQHYTMPVTAQRSSFTRWDWARDRCLWRERLWEKEGLRWQWKTPWEMSTTVFTTGNRTFRSNSDSLTAPRLSDNILSRIGNVELWWRVTIRVYTCDSQSSAVETLVMSADTHTSLQSHDCADIGPTLFTSVDLLAVCIVDNILIYLIICSCKTSRLQRS